MFDNVYFLHIPKTAGRFAYFNLLYPILEHLKNNNIEVNVRHDNTIASSSNVHQMWSLSFITENTYIISVLRDPAERIVSHYCHKQSYDINGKRRMPIGDPNINKKNLFKWVHERGESLQDYQSKNFLVDNYGVIKNFNVEVSEIFKKIIPDEISLDAKLKRVNLLIRSSDLYDKSKVKKIREKIMLDLGLPPIQKELPINTNPNFTNEESSNLYKTLKIEEINYFYSHSPFDTKIYNDNSYIWTP